MHVVSVAPDACEGLRRMNWSRDEYATGAREVISRWHGASKAEGCAAGWRASRGTELKLRAYYFVGADGE
jgi:hypothetical protein